MAMIGVVPTRLILDTDIGDDIDDVLALALILNSSQFDLRAITTVFVDAPRRARLARKMLLVWKREDVPVYAGCSGPLLQSYEPQACRQFEVLEDGGFEAASESDPMHGVDFLHNTPNLCGDPASEERLTILAIGPLTNVALALAREPELATRARLVLMGGQGLNGAEPEWNIIGDPEAAAMVFRSGIEIWQIGYDVTTQVQLDKSHLERITHFGSEKTDFLNRLIRLWQDGREKYPFLHDPLAALAMCSDCLTFEAKTVDVELCGTKRGMLSYSEPDESRVACHVAVSVDVQRAVDTFMDGVLV